MAPYRMQPTQVIDTYLANRPPELRDIVMELRSIIASVAPGATEEIRGNTLIYYYAERGGHVSAGVCEIGLRNDRVRLHFIHGAFLPDPQHLLEGDRKALRYIEITAYDTAPWDDLKDLIAASSQFDPRTLRLP